MRKGITILLLVQIISVWILMALVFSQIKQDRMIAESVSGMTEATEALAQNVALLFLNMEGIRQGGDSTVAGLGGYGIGQAIIVPNEDCAEVYLCPTCDCYFVRSEVDTGYTDKRLDGRYCSEECLDKALRAQYNSQ